MHLSMVEQPMGDAISQVDATLIGQEREQVLPKIFIHQSSKEVVVKDLAEPSDLHGAFRVTPTRDGHADKTGEIANCAFDLWDENMDGLDMIAAQPCREAINHDGSLVLPEQR